jgi:hypothetical protein
MQSRFFFTKNIENVMKLIDFVHKIILILFNLILDTFDSQIFEY